MPTGVYKRTKWHIKRLLDRNLKEENHPAWKGDKIGKERLHVWIVEKLGKPRICSECGTKIAKVYDWANISKNYKKDLNDYKRLWRKCHRNFDIETAIRGDKAPWSKLKEWEVLKIRELYKKGNVFQI